ncbi:MAG: hypothetical protein J6R40_04925, partial [Clostridia bacterium]|nr:hypothetical protein [Clostridia bacterium]
MLHQNATHSGGFFVFVVHRDSRTPLARAQVGFAFEHKPSGSLLTRGVAKNLRPWGEYPRFAIIFT